jgi:hypothetical protein
MSNHTKSTLTSGSEDVLIQCFGCGCNFENFDEPSVEDGENSFHSFGDEETSDSYEREDKALEILGTIEEEGEVEDEDETEDDDTDDGDGDDDDDDLDNDNDEDFLKHLNGNEGESGSDDTTSQTDIETDDECSAIDGESSNDSTISSAADSFQLNKKNRSFHQRVEQVVNIEDEEASVANTVNYIELFLAIDPVNDVEDIRDDAEDSSQLGVSPSMMIIATVQSDTLTGMSPIIEKIYSVSEAPSIISAVPSEQLRNRKGLFDLDTGETYVPSFDYAESLKRNKLMIQKARAKVLVDSMKNGSQNREKIIFNKNNINKRNKIEERNQPGYLTGSEGTKTPSRPFSFFGRSKANNSESRPKPLSQLIEQREDFERPTTVITPTDKVTKPREKGISLALENIQEHISHPAATSDRLAMVSGHSTASEAILPGNDRYEKKTKNKKITQHSPSKTSSSNTTGRHSNSTATKKLRNTSRTRSGLPSPHDRESLRIRNPDLLRQNRTLKPYHDMPMHVTKLHFQERKKPDDGIWASHDFLPLESLGSR